MSVEWFDVFAEAKSPVDPLALERIPAECLHLDVGSLEEGEYRAVGDLLRKRPGLRLTLSLGEGAEVEDLDEALRSLRGIRQLYVRMPSLSSLDPICQLASDLEHFGFDATKSRSLSLHPIAKLKGLRSLSLYRHARGFESIAELPRLEGLRLGGYKLEGVIADVAGGIRSLRSLKMKGGSGKSLGWVAGLTELRHLAIDSVREVTGVDFLRSLERLEYLYLRSAPQVTELCAFGALRRLRRVHLEQLKSICSLEGVAEAPQLEELVAVSMGGLDSEALRCFKGHATLSSVILGLKNRSATTRAEELLGRLPRAPTGTSFEFSNGERYATWLG